MPRAIASRGLSKTTGSPSIRISPLVGLWTPDMVLMKVDFPAPLSPSRQWHSPAMTDTDTPASAITEPKCFSMFRSSISGFSDISALPRDQAADIGVENNGEQQDDAEK